MIRERPIPWGLHEGAPGLEVHVPGDSEGVGDLTGALLDALRPCHVGYLLQLVEPGSMAVAERLIFNLAGRGSWAVPIIARGLTGPWPRFRCHLAIVPPRELDLTTTAADIARQIGEYGPRPRQEAISEIVLLGAEVTPVGLDTLSHVIAQGATATLYADRSAVRDAIAVARCCTYSWRVRPLDAVPVDD